MDRMLFFTVRWMSKRVGFVGDYVCREVHSDAVDRLMSLRLGANEIDG
jgi:hypothetical protein